MGEQEWQTARSRRWLAAFVAIVVIGLGVVSGRSAAAASPVEESERALVERYAPLMMIKRQSADCATDGEPYHPTSIDIVLDNPDVALRQVGPGDPVRAWGPSASDLFGLGEGFFVDFPGSALEPGCVFERGLRRYDPDERATIYAHVVHPPGEPDLLVVQYWFYWYYNDWNNKHESDWEGIALLFEASSVDEAIVAGPTAVGYSQHEGGERSDWHDAKLERVGDRPVVYSSAGSHASYFESAVYLGRGASEGFGCDDTTGPSDRLDPEVVLLPDDVDDPSDPLAWLAFDGRWGERQGGPFNGPTGPALKSRWLDPMPWFDELRESSVVIPAGESQASTLIGVFCDIVEGGSTTLIRLTVSPTMVILSLAVVVVLGRWMASRTDWSRVPASPVRRRRRLGQIVRSSGRVYRSAPLTYVVFGLAYIPASIAAGVFAAVLDRIPGIGPLLETMSGASGTNLVVAALIGSFAGLAAAVFVNAAVADHLRADERGLAGAVASIARTWERRSALAAMFLRSFLIVAGLLMTIVGAPWAIRQAVRYQFAPLVIVDEGVGARRAMQRSTELVAGRWWHTAVAVTVFNLAVVVVAGAVGMAVLVLATGVPIWAVSIIVPLVSALVVPRVAIAMALLHGDALAGGDDNEAVEELTVS